MSKEVLVERGKRYGEFKNLARLSQNLKNMIRQHINEYGNPSAISAPSMEALDMTLHKIARIANGDPLYIDNWRDGSSYMQLAVDELQETENATDAVVTIIRKRDGEWKETND